MNKKDVAELLKSIGTLLETQGENEFKVRAYYNGAKIIENIDEDIEELVKENRLMDIKGIGKALAEKITEYVNTGGLQYYNSLVSDTPDGIFEFLKIPGLGPKRVREIFNTLGIRSIGELEYACLENRLINYKGFGEKIQEKIIEGIKNINKYRGKLLYPDAVDAAYRIISILNSSGIEAEFSISGELRRKLEVISCIDIVASTENKDGLLRFIEESNIFTGSHSLDENTVSGISEQGVELKIHIVSSEKYIWALFTSTGSQEHIKGLGAKLQNIDFDRLYSEETIYSELGIEYIGPELREGRGEIDAAANDKLPRLVSYKDIKGVFHVHTSYSDGTNTIEEMASAAKAMGYSYLGIGDHSKSAFYARGLSESDVRRQLYEISLYNDKDNGIRILKGIECDILEDGSLDYDNSILEIFDYVVASVHSRFNMSREDMTERIKKAMGNKYVTIIGHPTGRILLAREPYNVDMEQIIKTAADYGKVLEINANPYRLDIDWRYLKFGKDMGVKFAVNPDAHNIHGIYDTVYGVNTARKGWLEAKDLINTMDINEIRRFLVIK